MSRGRCLFQKSALTGMEPAAPMPLLATCRGSVSPGLCLGRGLVSETGEMSSSRGSHSADTDMMAQRRSVVSIHVVVSHARFMVSSAMSSGRGMIVLVRGLDGHALCRPVYGLLQCVQSGRLARLCPLVAMAGVLSSTAGSVPLSEAKGVVAPKWGAVCPWLSIGATLTRAVGQGRTRVLRRDLSHFSERGYRFARGYVRPFVRSAGSSGPADGPSVAAGAVATPSAADSAVVVGSRWLVALGVWRGWSGHPWRASGRGWASPCVSVVPCRASPLLMGIESELGVCIGLNAPGAAVCRGERGRRGSLGGVVGRGVLNRRRSTCGCWLGAVAVTHWVVAAPASAL